MSGTTVKDNIGYLLQLNQSFLLPTRPVFVLRNFLNKGHDSLDDMQLVVEKDPLLAVFLLREANDKSYGSPGKINTVKDAFKLMGNRNVLNFLNRLTETVQMSKEGLEQVDPIWRHCLGAAVAAECVFEYRSVRMAAYTYIGGLLHDIGKLIVMKNYPGDWESVVKAIGEDPDRMTLTHERQLWKITHADLGAYVLNRWGLPVVLQNCVKYHHYLERKIDYQEYVATVAMGNNIAKAMELGKSPTFYIEPLPNEVWAKIKEVETKELDPLVERIQHRFDASIAFINYHFGQIKFL